MLKIFRKSNWNYGTLESHFLITHQEITETKLVHVSFWGRVFILLAFFFESFSFNSVQSTDLMGRHLHVYMDAVPSRVRTAMTLLRNKMTRRRHRRMTFHFGCSLVFFLPKGEAWAMILFEKKSPTSKVALSIQSPFRSCCQHQTSTMRLSDHKFVGR